MNQIVKINQQKLALRKYLYAKKITTTKDFQNVKFIFLKNLPRPRMIHMAIKEPKIQKNESPNYHKSASPSKTLVSPNNELKTNSSTITAPYGTLTKTRITVKYDVGFNNNLYLRGNAAGLNWDKGTPMRNTKADEWVWETELPFTTAEFKTLINDTNFESGRNHLLHCGTIVQYTPRF
jgi:hypothetical protein